MVEGHRFIHGHNRRGEHHLDETKQRMGCSISKALKGRTYEKLYGAERAQQLKLMRSQRKKEQWEKDQDYKLRMTIGCVGERNHFHGKHHSLDSRLKMARSHIGVPLSDEHTRAILLANQVKPNRTEARLLIILGPPWRYVGDGKLVIGGKCPDFWDGDANLIELFGDYWHRGDDSQDRVRHFREFGYNCDIIWEHDVPRVVEKDGLERLRQELPK